MMNRVKECEKQVKAKSFETALRKFVKAFNLEDEGVDEMFRWLWENGKEHECDDVYGDGSYNKDWNVSYWLYEMPEHGEFYFCYILREEAN